ncbi:glycosyltransferase [Acidobacteria bacterium AH-259-O06]|nr:glycosyltransferase [Acidobacteria bacterium AH-259-O06]
MNPTLSIVLTCYKGEAWIPQTIESVLNQDYENLELIIVNDASPDNSAAILEKYKRQDSRIHILSNPTNRGIATSRNRGLKEMKGIFFSILDQDDLWKPSKAFQQIAYFDQNPNIDAVYCRVELINAKGESLGERPLPHAQTGNLFTSFFKNGLACSLLSCMFRSSLLARTGMFNETLQGHDDFEFLLRVAHTAPFGFIPKVLVQGRYQPESFSQTESMVFDQFQLADVLETTWPQYPQLVKRYRSRVHYNTAQYFLENKRINEASYHFLRSALYRPLFCKAWYFWITAHLLRVIRERLPKKLRSFLQLSKHR